MSTKPDSAANLPNLHSLENERLKIFWILAEEAKQNPEGALSSYTIAQRFERNHRIHIPRHRIDAILRKEKGTVLRKPRGGTEYWKIMRDGFVELTSPSSATTFINPSSAFTARKLVKEILAELSGPLRFCDPYIDASVLDTLTACSNAKNIKLLTSRIHGNGFGNDLAAFNKEFGDKIQVRSASKGKLHDRYIIHDAGMILIGASLKDIGKAPSFVVALGPDLTSAVSEHFEAAWTSATIVS